jgi:Arc/MetJ family transcription regulator
MMCILIHIWERAAMRTNIVLDDVLVTRAFKLSRSTTKRALVDEALHELVRMRSRKSLLDLKGQIRLRDGYDYKRSRAGR